MAPISRYFFFLPKSDIIAPTPINIGANAVTLNAINCAVTVVPIFAPRITPAAWVRDIKAAFTNPTTITVVVLEL